MEPVTLNVFPTQILCKLTSLRTIELENQALTETAASLSCLRQLHTLCL